MKYEVLATSSQPDWTARGVIHRDLQAAHDPDGDGQIVLAASETLVSATDEDEVQGYTTYLGLTLDEVRALHAYLGRLL